MVSLVLYRYLKMSRRVQIISSLLTLVNFVQFWRTVGLFNNQNFLKCNMNQLFFFWHHNAAMPHNDFPYFFPFSSVASGIIFTFYFSSSTIQNSNSSICNLQVSICNSTFIHMYLLRQHIFLVIYSYGRSEWWYRKESRAQA